MTPPVLLRTKRTTHHPGFWIALALIVAASVAFSARNFVELFPVAGIELEMDREGALQAARELGERYGWGPEGFRQAATFTDPAPEVRTYLELEAGEDDSLGRLLQEGDYHPFRWKVRHFRERETREVTVHFTPGGAPYGFRLRLPEDQPGPALPAENARAIAEAEAHAGWGIELGLYELVESSQETRPGGRIDHTFVYVRTGSEIGEADFRLRLGVAGGELSEVTSFVQVPEAFVLRYAEMRTANTRIALTASLLFLLLFLVVGCGGGLFYLIRIRWLEWKAPLAWGGIVAALSALAILNDLPVAWMDYDTALSYRGFLLEIFLLVAAYFVGGTILLAGIFMVAESLGRRAFPDQPQQWRFWHPDVARTGPALGRTLGGYAVAAIEIGFVVAFYLWAMRREGWWMPPEAVVEPDLVASYVPWLSAVAPALSSGFWEESVFRAIPIAGAALIGTRYGGRRWWILAALILQAAVFAAGHADYPQQPAYARLAELFLPALVLGVLYIRFGLIPVILAHASYNLTLASVPLWAASVPGIWVDRFAIVAIGLLPLWIVLWHVVRKGYRPDLPAWASHAAWHPREEGEEEATPEPAAVGAPSSHEAGERVGETAAAASGAMPRDGSGTEGASSPHTPFPSRAFLLGCALAGVALLAIGLRIPSDFEPLAIDRHEAAELAREVLAERGITLDDEWRAIPTPVSRSTPAHRFIRDEGGPGAYGQLLGRYLRGIGWDVRFARFTGPVEDRAEAFLVALEGDDRLHSFSHRLPETRSGAELGEEEARSLATIELERAFGLPPDGLEEVSAIAEQHPDRRDWTFVWSDLAGYPLQRGEARLRIRIAGDRVTGHDRFVHVPEEWERERQANEARLSPLRTLGAFAGLLLLAGGALAGLVRWARGGLDRRAATAVALAAFALFTVPDLNRIPLAGAGFSTTQGFEEQLLVSLVMRTFAYAVAAGALGLAAGLAHGWLCPDLGRQTLPRRPEGAPHPAFVGGALGLLWTGASRAGHSLGPLDPPTFPSLSGTGAVWPPLTNASGPAFNLLLAGIVLLLILVTVDWLTEGWTRRRVLGLGGLVLAGFIPAPTVAEAVWGKLIPGLVTGLALLGLYRLVRSWGVAFVPWLAATIAAVGLVGPLVRPMYDGARLGAFLGLVLLAWIAHRWSRYAQRPSGVRIASTPVPSVELLHTEPT